jgi:hypothetical protein
LETPDETGAGDRPHATCPAASSKPGQRLARHSYGHALGCMTTGTSTRNSCAPGGQDRLDEGYVEDVGEAVTITWARSAGGDYCDS